MLVVWRLMVTHIANLVYMGLWVVWYFFERIIYYHLTEPLARYLYILSRGRHSDLTGSENFIFKFQIPKFNIYYSKKNFQTNSSLCFMKLISLFILIFITIPKLVFAALICENFENEFGSLWAIAWWVPFFLILFRLYVKLYLLKTSDEEYWLLTLYHILMVCWQNIWKYLNVHIIRLAFR